MDVRAAITGALAALGKDAATVAGLLGLSGTFGGYTVGLYSSPFQGPDE